jgi:Pvc16 N-terminal domain/Carboxypeptidase regulatory-like domain
VFHDLDSTLTALLNDAPQVELPELHDADVSFETPDRSFAPGQATVDLFLYEVRENRELRDPEPIVERVGGVAVQRPPPIRADCSYILTTWSLGLTGAARIAAEHNLLGQALQWLSRFAIIPEQYLQGSLTNPRRIYPLPTMVAHLDPDQHAGEFWTALGIPPRPGFYLTVTTELPLGAGVESPLVTTTVSDYGFEEQINLGGIVRDPGGAPVPHAWVGLAWPLDPVTNRRPREESTQTDAIGRFTFVQVLRGTGYSLHASATGHTDVTRPVDVPSPSGDYDLQFP